MWGMLGSNPLFSLLPILTLLNFGASTSSSWRLLVGSELALLGCEETLNLNFLANQRSVLLSALACFGYVGGRKLWWHEGGKEEVGDESKHSRIVRACRPNQFLYLASSNGWNQASLNAGPNGVIYNRCRTFNLIEEDDFLLFICNVLTAKRKVPFPERGYLYTRAGCSH